jgi:hypothetical protein
LVSAAFFFGRIDQWQKGGRKTCMFSSWEAYEKLKWFNVDSVSRIFQDRFGS